MKKKKVTAKQLEILTLMSGNESKTGRFIDFDQLLEKLSWSPSKESAQFTMRAMVNKGFIKKCGLESRRGRVRVCYGLDKEGEIVLDPRKIDDSKVKKASEFSLPEVSDSFLESIKMTEMDFKLM